MNHVLGKIRKKGNANKFRKILSDCEVYKLPDNLESYVPYNPDHNLDEEDWFGIPNFSKQEYCLEILKESFNSTEYNTLEKGDINQLDFLCSYQDGNYHFQKIGRNQLLVKKE